MLLWISVWLITNGLCCGMMWRSTRATCWPVILAISSKYDNARTEQQRNWGTHTEHTHTNTPANRRSEYPANYVEWQTNQIESRFRTHLKNCLPSICRCCCCCFAPVILAGQRFRIRHKPMCWFVVHFPNGRPNYINHKKCILFEKGKKHIGFKSKMQIN